ncbi:MAG TPA: c-type cytochrome [Thermoanaerobaculia bacterium]|jgi:hypothetical protein
MKKTAIVTLILTLGCTSMQQRPSQARNSGPSEFKNLKILPRNISRDELTAIMRNFSRSLGVQCNHCHIVTATTPKTQFDFPSDAKEEKRVARVMMLMTNEINTSWMEQVEAAEGEDASHRESEEQSATAAPAMPRVACWTCHRGKPEPEMPPPPPAAAPAPKPAT